LNECISVFLFKFRIIYSVFKETWNSRLNAYRVITADTHHQPRREPTMQLQTFILLASLLVGTIATPQTTEPDYDTAGPVDLSAPF